MDGGVRKRGGSSLEKGRSVLRHRLFGLRVMSAVKKIVRKGSIVGEKGFIRGGGNMNWFPGPMAAVARAIRDRVKLSDFVIEVRDASISLSSANQELQPMLEGKRRVIALNNKDLANANIIHILVFLLLWTYPFSVFIFVS